MANLLLKLFVCCVYLPSIASGAIAIVFGSSSPPASIPADNDKVYSVAVNSIMGKSVVATIEQDGVVVKSGPLSAVKFNVTSIDHEVHLGNTVTDAWADSGGFIRQIASRIPYPTGLNDRHFKLISENRLTLSNIGAFMGGMEVQGLIHEHPDSAPAGKRVLEFKFVYESTVIKAYTHPFDVGAAAAKLKFITAPPSTIIANTPFSVSAEILDKDDNRITTGFDSALNVVLQTAWLEDHKIFYAQFGYDMMLYETKVRMDSTTATVMQSSYNTVIVERAVAGVVTFTDVRILDVHSEAVLNMTMMRPIYPWTMEPVPAADEMSKMVVFLDPSNETSLFYVDPTGPIEPAVLLSSPIDVTEQEALSIVITNLADLVPKIGANFHLEPEPIVEVRDTNNRRIYSGRDAELDITAVLNPGTTCLSSDAAFKTKEGVGKFTGSICEEIASVVLHFEANTVITPGNLVSGSTPAIQVTNDIYLAHFCDLKYSGSGSEFEPHLDNFIKFAKQDINNGVFAGVLTGRTLHINSYDHENDVVKTAVLYQEAMEIGKKDPSKKIQGVIGFGTNTLTENMASLTKRDKVPQIATREDSSSFGDKVVYPYFNRVCWDQGGLYHSIMLAFNYRKWTSVVIVKNTDITISNLVYEKAKLFGIEIVMEVSIPSVDEYTPGVYLDEMKRVRDAGVRIIWYEVRTPESNYMLREASNLGIDGLHGYQWFAPGAYGWSFPWSSGADVCRKDPPCTVAFIGFMAIASTYMLTGLQTGDWRRVLTTHLERDPWENHGTTRKFTFNEVFQEMALGYDAVIIYAKAMSQLIQDQKTISGESLTEAIRQVTWYGLTGTLNFDEKGNRPGYRGMVVVSNPQPPLVTTHPGAVAIFSRILLLENDQATTQVEVPMQAFYPLYLPPTLHILANFTTPVAEFMNNVSINSAKGMISRNTQMLEEIPGETGTELGVTKWELTPAPFFCEHGCGGGALDSSDITLFANGHCASMGVCDCDDGWDGLACDQMICSCSNGICKVPRVCICTPGWEGEKCDLPICSVDCGNGECTAPETCTCVSGWISGFGGECAASLAAVVVIALLLSILVLTGLVLGVRKYLKIAAEKAAMADLEWLVKWDDITMGTKAMSFLSTASDMKTNKINVGTWNSQKCYIQCYDCDTLDLGDPNLRLEIVRVRKLRNNNLITFNGACLDYPNVSILTEIVPKGSLEDLLCNDSVRLGWDFKYSMLKDICRGMDYLHRHFGSHGRLKSPNCLIDNRWTVKLTGFGFQKIRFAGPRRIPEDKEVIFKWSSLFWTAPEFLKTCKTVDDVGVGTKEADFYAFAIILTEMLTREQPFSNELQYLTEEQIIDLVYDRDAPANAEAKAIWYDNGGDVTKPFRPHVPEEFLPEDYQPKSMMLKMLSNAWSKDIQERPTFVQMLNKLNDIHPVKGELIDNLVNMLEKYSSNLEAIVLERTKELQVEKAKTEQLVSQMLPKKVVEDLKHGKTVEPESFACVTIYFSDIVGFTAIAKDSTPFQVVDLLNDLYTTFDSILDNYDTYKVETIGDAYMVVSGLPIRNGDLHAGEIASVSLDLLASMCDFKIRHMPDKHLQLRIGMHSGPVVAGVVGLKMPRYCLFGDTVNTASRMESSSIALKIHMSEMTADILMKLGGYHLDCRGEREVKGKGVMKTYWLNGKDGFDKKLPGRDMAVSLSQHEFK